MTTTFRAPVPAARTRVLPSPRVLAVAIAAILLGTVGALAIVRVVSPASTSSAARASAGAATTTAAPPYALVHASAIELGPEQITVARNGTLQLMNMGTAPVRLAVQGTKAAATVEADDVVDLPLTGLKPGRYTLQAQRPDGRPTALTVRVTIVK